MSSASGNNGPLSAAQAAPYVAVATAAATNGVNGRGYRPSTNIFGLTLPSDLPLATDRDSRFLPVVSPVGTTQSQADSPVAATFPQQQQQQQLWSRDGSQDSVDSMQPESSTAAATRAAQMSQAQAGPVAKPANSSYMPMWSTKPRVLLVDDDVVSRTVSSKFLNMLGCSFDTAHDGVAALERMNGGGGKVSISLSWASARCLSDAVRPRLDGKSHKAVRWRILTLRRMLGHCHAAFRRVVRDDDDTTVRPAHAHHLHDGQFRARRYHAVLLARWVISYRRLSSA